MNPKRLFDLGLSLPALALAMPLIAGAAMAVALSGGTAPVFVRVRRVGEGGREIGLLRIRTTRIKQAEPGSSAQSDQAPTLVGRALRRFNLDQLPQLWNVLRGDLSLVGPPAKDPRFMDWTDPVHRRVFTSRPGITGWAQVRYRHEDDQALGGDPEEFYRTKILPATLRLDSEYLDRNSLRVDVAILAETLWRSLGGRPGTAHR